MTWTAFIPSPANPVRPGDQCRKVVDGQPWTEWTPATFAIGDQQPYPNIEYRRPSAS